MPSDFLCHFRSARATDRGGPPTDANAYYEWVAQSESPGAIAPQDAEEVCSHQIGAECSIQADESQHCRSELDLLQVGGNH
jgi:hypothetical protein